MDVRVKVGDTESLAHTLQSEESEVLELGLGEPIAVLSDRESKKPV